MQIPETEIIVTKDGTELLRKTVRPGDYVVGREPECEVQVDADLVSPRHAQITVNFDHVLIEDLGSDSGTFVNGEPIKECTRLWPNQKIQIGSARVELRRIKTVTPPDVTLAPSTAAVKRLLPEEFLHEKKYDIGGVVAQGGMGAILNAKEASIERTVAMKVMLDGSNPDDLTRFVAEARITGQLEHPNVIPVHELSVDENGQPFYTMKMVRGITLRKVLELLAEGVPETVQKYPLPVLLTIFQKVCDAIAFAHNKGVIHRDLKPENIMLDDFGVVLVMDWGLAKNVGGSSQSRVGSGDAVAGPALTPAEEGLGSPASAGFTLAGAVMGTPQFMAPEQARGEVERLDARADIYSLGAILYQILALRPPLEGDDAWAIVERVGVGKIDPLDMVKKHPHLPGGRVPDSLAAVVGKAMALDREARYPQVEALQKDITAYQNGFATLAEKAGAWRQIKLLVQRNKTASIAAGVVMALTCGFTAKVISEGRVAERALSDLRGTAPEFAARAAELFANEKFEEADRKLVYAITLDPKNVGFRLTRANFYEAQLRFSKAVKAFREVLALDPGNATAQEHAALCEPLDRTRGADGKFPRTTLTQLLDAMTKENRPAAEKFAVAKLLGRENDALREVWLEKLKALPVGNRTLKDRLVIAPDGRMQLKLSDTPISDLSPLRGMPLSELEISQTLVSDLGPLKGMKLEWLKAVGCRITDLTPLAGMPLRVLSLNSNRITNISALAGMPLEALNLEANPIKDLSPLHGMPLHYLDINGSTTTDLNALRGMPLTEQLNLTLVREIRDLIPLTGMHLKTLVLVGNDRINDLTPLHECPFESLIIKCQQITDISAIANPKLRQLSLAGSNGIIDVRPLSVCADLEELVLPPHAKDIEFLRALPKLRNLGYRADLYGQWTTTTATQFWKDYDAQQAAGKK